MIQNSLLEEARIEEIEVKNLLDKFVNTSTHLFRFLIIEGPAGSGKTEYLRYLKEIAKDKKIIFSAPTRQAASNLRLREINYARTTQKVMSDFIHQVRDPRDYDIFVIDEAALITKENIEELFQHTWINQNLKYLFVGDTGQNFPWNPNSRTTEHNFYALEIDKLKSSFKKLYDKYDKPYISDIEFREIKLKAKWRLLNKSKPVTEEYVELLDSLRDNSYDSGFENLLSYKEIHEFKEQDYISHLINTNHEGLAYSLYKIITRNGLDKEEKINRCVEEILDSTYWKNNVKASFRDFDIDEIRNTIQKRFNLEFSRPKMGEIYNEFFSTKKNNSTNVICLFRSNKHVHQANLEIRQHLNHFKDNFSKIEKAVSKGLIQSELQQIVPVKGDFLFVAGDDEDLFFDNFNQKTNTQEPIYPGDLVIASSNIKRNENTLETLSVLFNEKNYFFELEVEPLIYLPDNLLKKFTQRIFKQKRTAFVWVGGLIEGKENAYSLFRQQIDILKNYIEKAKKAATDDVTALEEVLRNFKLEQSDYLLLKSNLQKPITKINGYTAKDIEIKVNEVKNDKLSKIKSLLSELSNIAENSFLIYYAYALTHRTAQGGEWKNVIIESADFWEQDQNRFLYTALTRSLDSVYLSYIK